MKRSKQNKREGGQCDPRDREFMSWRGTLFDDGDGSTGKRREKRLFKYTYKVLSDMRGY